MRSVEPGGGAAAARLLAGPERVAFTTSFDGYAVASFVNGTRITFPIYLYAALRFPSRLPEVSASLCRPLERVLRADDAEITRSVDPERVARNDATFREANERIHEAAQEYELQGPMPFICECAEATCTTIVRVTLSGYAEVRANPVRFIVAAGHELPDTDIEQVVERRGGYFVIEKVGRAADIAADLDPRP